MLRRRKMLHARAIPSLAGRPVAPLVPRRAHPVSVASVTTADQGLVGARSSTTVSRMDDIGLMGRTDSRRGSVRRRSNSSPGTQ
jgi:hypothetical protein